MPSFEERQKRKAIKGSLKATEAGSVRESLPITAQQMKSLFDFVDEHLSDSECDHSLRHTLAFLESQGIPAEPVVPWLRNAHGYCDCEVLFNAEEKFNFAFPSNP
ncbi:MAG TPA: DUF2695 domain-containing protein [Terriglobales bacterium]|jgi:hypothetical protein|nr:DUF2695 domain-containing protein [Terriglobales bacterium]